MADPDSDELRRRTEQAERERDRAQSRARTWKQEAWSERRDHQVTRHNSQRDEARLEAALAAATARIERMQRVIDEAFDIVMSETAIEIADRWRSMLAPSDPPAHERQGDG